MATATTGRHRAPSRPRRHVRVLGLVGVLVLLLAACTTASAPVVPAAAASGSTPATQTSEGGQVTVQATWDGPGAGPIFQVVLDTHSVDLDGYDLRERAVLRTGSGREVRPTGWDAPRGGHHRSGLLTFPATAADGSPLLGPDAGSVELLIRDVAGVPERRFQWTP